MEATLKVKNKTKNCDNLIGIIQDYELMGIILYEFYNGNKPNITLYKMRDKFHKYIDTFNLKVNFTDEQFRLLMVFLWAYTNSNGAYYEKFKEEIKSKLPILSGYIAEGKFTLDDIENLYSDLTRFYFINKPNNQFIFEKEIFADDLIIDEIKKYLTNWNV